MAAVALSTRRDIVLPVESVLAVFPSHRIIIILYVMCDTFPPGKTLGAQRGPSFFLCSKIS